MKIKLYNVFKRIYYYDKRKKVAQIISDVTKKPWIATLKHSGGARHTVIVDKINNGLVYIRDPWGAIKGFGGKNGIEAVMKLDDFEYFWKGAKYHNVRVK